MAGVGNSSGPLEVEETSSPAEATRKRDEAGREECSTASRRITRVKLDEIEPGAHFNKVSKFINAF